MRGTVPRHSWIRRCGYVSGLGFTDSGSFEDFDVRVEASIAEFMALGLGGRIYLLKGDYIPI